MATSFCKAHCDMSKVCGCDGGVLAEKERVAAEGNDDRSSRRGWEIKGRHEERMREREQERKRHRERDKEKREIESVPDI